MIFPKSFLEEYERTLSWALDVLDKYDEHLAEIDGEENVFTEIHVTGKTKARRHLRQLRRFLDGDTWEPDDEKRETAAGLCLTSMAVGYALADSFEAGRSYPEGFFGTIREKALADDVREALRKELDAHEDPLE